MRVLVVNAGSSSLKLRVLEPDDRLAASVDLPAPDSERVEVAVEAAVGRFGRIDAVGHRVVHGGTEFLGPTVVDRAVRARLGALTDLAPLHQPKSLAGLDAVSAVLPDVPVVACFDTAFHAGMPAAAATYALPEEWRSRWGIRRFGFHGLSHAYASRRVAALWGTDPPRPFRVVTCHLGAGASLAAVLDGGSVDTTMGFTPLEGLVMATRSGSVDPGLVLWLQTHAGLSADEVMLGLDRRSGLLGLSGAADMRDVLAGAGRGEAAPTLALDVCVHRLAASIAAMSAALGGLDALVFTGGVGEHAPVVRARAAERTAFLGVALDAAANEATANDLATANNVATANDAPASKGTASSADREIGARGAPVRTFVVEAREDLEIAREVRALLA
jgi:acetate kinase